MDIQKELKSFNKIVTSFRNEKNTADDYSNFKELFNNPTFRLFTERTAQAIMVYNYLENKYEYVSNSIERLYGQSPDAFKSPEGVAKVIQMMSPASTQMMINDVTPLLFEFSNKYPNDITDLRYTACVELLDDFNKNKWVLFHNSILCATKENFPILSCNIITEVTSLKKDNALYYSVFLKDRLLLHKSIGKAPGFMDLTKREAEIVELLCKGKTTKEIADLLFVSFETVKQHRKNILLKTNCINTAELANVISTMGLL